MTLSFLTVSVQAVRELLDIISDASELLPPIVTERYILAEIIGQVGIGRACT
jgi:hypothetical protein